MPEERIYERQVTPREASGLPMASPEAFGAGVGRAVADLGGELHRGQVQAYRLERQQTADRELADFMHGFSLHRQNMDGIVREKRANAAPGALGHTMETMEANEAAREGLFAGISEDGVRRRAQQMWDDYSGRLQDNEAGFEEAGRIDKMVQDVQVATDVAANRVRMGMDPAAYGEELKLGYAAIDALQGVPADTKAKLKRELVDQKYSAAFLNHLNDTNPQAAVAMIDAGTFNDALTPEQLERARNGALVEVRRGEAAAAQAANMEKAQTRETIATVEEQARQGVDVSGALPGLIQAAEAMGDTSKAESLRGLLADSAFAKIWGPVSPAERAGRMTELGNKANPSAADQRELAWLRDKSPALDAKFNADPVGFALVNAPEGQKPPTLDFSDPASIAARSQWAAAASQAYGRPVPPLSANEAAALRDQYATGRAGRIDVMDNLALLPARQAAIAARQVDPNNEQLRVMVTLPRGYRSLALDGEEALKGNRALLKVDDDDEKATIDTQNARFAEAMRGVDPAQRRAILLTAGQIEAGLLARAGGERDAGLAWRALNMAMGAIGTGSDRKGGLASWSDHWFVLPDGVTPKAWGIAVQRAAATGKTKPVNPDGSPALLRNARPVMVGNGVYEFRTAGDATVFGSDGKPWRVTVRPK